MNTHDETLFGAAVVAAAIQREAIINPALRDARRAGKTALEYIRLARRTQSSEAVDNLASIGGLMAKIAATQARIALDAGYTCVLGSWAPRERDATETND